MLFRWHIGWRRGGGLGLRHVPVYLAALLLIGWLSAGERATGAEPDADSGEATRLVFRIAPEEGKETPAEALDATVTALRRRLDAVIAGGGARRLRDDRIEVLIPTTDPDQVARVRRFITRPGTLEFAIVANRRDHAELIRAAEDVERDYLEEGELRARWIAPAANEDGEPRELHDRGEVATRQVERDGERVTQYLVVFEPEQRRVTGAYVARAERTTDESGRPAVEFEFNRRGSELMRELTGRNRPTPEGFGRRLAILIDGRIYQAPEIRTQIGGRGQITGLGERAAGELTALLQLGRLPVPIGPDPIVEGDVPGETVN